MHNPHLTVSGEGCGNSEETVALRYWRPGGGRRGRGGVGGSRHRRVRRGGSRGGRPFYHDHGDHDADWCRGAARRRNRHRAAAARGVVVAVVVVEVEVVV